MAYEVDSRKEVLLCEVNAREMRVYLGSRCGQSEIRVEGDSRIFLTSLLPYFLATGTGMAGRGRVMWMCDGSDVG